MVVLITNVTDAPGKNPLQIDIYNKTLSPGSHVKIPADLVNEKIRALEKNGFIAIGNLPPWYLTAKHKGRPLSEEERNARAIRLSPKLIPKAERLEKEPSIKKG